MLVVSIQWCHDDKIVAVYPWRLAYIDIYLLDWIWMVKYANDKNRKLHIILLLRKIVLQML